MTTKRVFHVKKTFGGPMSFRKHEDYAVGDKTIGEFVGYHTDQYKKTNYKIKVLDAQWEDADAATAMIGKTLVFNACGSLDKQMEEVKEGMNVLIEYNGKGLITKGIHAGKEAHGYSVSEIELEPEAPKQDDALNGL